MGDWGHSLLELLGTVLGVLVSLWIYSKTERNERQKTAEVEKEERERMHQENQEKFNKLIDELDDYPPHLHTERDGALTVGGIQMKRRRLFGSD